MINARSGSDRRQVLIVVSALLFVLVPVSLGLWFRPDSQVALVVDLRGVDLRREVNHDKVDQDVAAASKGFAGTWIVLVKPTETLLSCVDKTPYCPKNVGANRVVIKEQAVPVDDVLKSIYGQIESKKLGTEGVVRRVSEPRGFRWDAAALGALLVGESIALGLLVLRLRQSRTPAAALPITPGTPGYPQWVPRQPETSPKAAVHPPSTTPAPRPRATPNVETAPAESRQFRFRSTAARPPGSAEVRRVVQDAGATGVARTHISTSGGGYVAIGDVTVWASGAGQINPGDPVRLAFADSDGGGLMAIPVSTPTNFIPN